MTDDNTGSPPDYKERREGDRRQSQQPLMPSGQPWKAPGNPLPKSMLISKNCALSKVMLASGQRSRWCVPPLLVVSCGYCKSALEPR